MREPNDQASLLLRKIADALRIDPKEFAQRDGSSEALEAQAILLVKAFTRVSDQQMRKDCIRFVEKMADRDFVAKRGG